MVEFKAILSVESAMVAVERNSYALKYVPEALMSEAVVFKAVESDSYALKYVLKKSLFISLAAKFEIPINIKDPAANAAKAYTA